MSQEDKKRQRLSAKDNFQEAEEKLAVHSLRDSLGDGYIAAVAKEVAKAVDTSAIVAKEVSKAVQEAVTKAVQEAVTKAKKRQRLSTP